MPLKERITNVDELRSWKDEIPLHYEYTAGVAGERFLRGLEQGKILAAVCPKCGKAYLPPKTYCVDCYVAISEFRDVSLKARVAALASSEFDLEGKKLPTPRTFAFVTFQGVSGGLVHYVAGEGIRLGTPVTAKFRPSSERKGTLLDIEGFVA